MRNNPLKNLPITRKTGNPQPLRAYSLAVLSLITSAMMLTVGPANATSNQVESSDEGYAYTSALEARRINRVKAIFEPHECKFSPPNYASECGIVRVPLDYDEPNGQKIEIEVARLRSAKPGKRIGTLFFNPGGPGFASTGMALFSADWLDQRILDRFDIVGVDSRGTGINPSNQARCFHTQAEQNQSRIGLPAGYPLGEAEEAATLDYARRHAEACSTTGLPLTASMSTAESARDMEVARRALGVKKLSFFGVSYGSYLGQVYANMFPDRFQAMILDGIIDPVSLATGRNGPRRGLPPDLRTDDAAANQLALTEFLARCDQAGSPTCAFAGTGNSLAKWHLMMTRLAEHPVTYPDLITGEPTSIGQARMAVETMGILTTMKDIAHGEDARLAGFLQDIFVLTEPNLSSTQRTERVARVSAVRAELREQLTLSPENPSADDYIPLVDAYYGIRCSDSIQPEGVNRWPDFAEKANLRKPYFGRIYAWNAPQCAAELWQPRDEDRYLGPFNLRTKAPILLVGNYYDPATGYRNGALRAAKTLGNARLLTSDSWGHTAYGVSDCVNDAVANYLLNGALPPEGSICAGDQPFGTGVATNARTSVHEKHTTGRPIPIRPFLPGLID